MSIRILTGDCRPVLATLPSESVNCIVTSPPYYGLRDYGVAGQIGLEQTPDAYVAELVAVFRECRRVMRDDATLWLNLGDSYAGGGGGNYGSGRTVQYNDANPSHLNNSKRLGAKPKDLLGIPWRVAFALQADGWYLRQDIIWAKPNPMPESVRDRCTKAHEYVFLLSKSARYAYDAEAIAEDAAYPCDRRELARDFVQRGDDLRGRKSRMGASETRNRRSVWTIATQPFSESHFATMPPDLAELCIKAGCPKGGTVLDPFGGAGTTGLVADRLGRNAILIELNPAYAAMAAKRVQSDAGMFAMVAAE